MTTILASIAVLTIAATVIGKALKTHLDRHYPNVDDEGELEAILARRLSVDLKRAVK